jgi:hypothetical protein
MVVRWRKRREKGGTIPNRLCRECHCGAGHLEIGMQMIAKPFVVTALANKAREMIEGVKSNL